MQKKISDLIAENKIDKAVSVLESNIENNRERGENSLLLAEVCVLQNNIRKAINVLEKSLENISTCEKQIQFETCRMLGELYTRQNYFKEALVMFKKALLLKKEDAEVYFLMGLLFLEMRKTDNAFKVFLYLTDKYPEIVLYRINFALSYVQREEWDMAGRILQDIINKKEEPQAVLFMGYLYYKKKDYERALHFLEEAAKHKSQRLKAFYYMGRIHFKNKSYRKALEFLSRAGSPALSRNYKLNLHYTLALCHEAERDFHSSLENLRIVYDLDPSFKDTAEKLFSENYKIISTDYLLDYNTLSEGDFRLFCYRLVQAFNLKPEKHIFNDNETVVLKARVNRQGLVYKYLEERIDYFKPEVVLMIFTRGKPVKEQILDLLIKKADFKFSRGILFTSGQISALAINYAFKNNIDVIVPTTLNKIVKELQRIT